MEAAVRRLVTKCESSLSRVRLQLLALTAGIQPRPVIGRSELDFGYWPRTTVRFFLLSCHSSLLVGSMWSSECIFELNELCCEYN